MSEQFTYTPGGAETLDQFNLRVAQFCRDNVIIDIVPSVSGKTLMLSLMEPEDVPFELPWAYQPHVLLAHEADMLNLERSIGDVKAKVQDAVGATYKAKPEDVVVPRVQMLSLPSQPDSCYIMMLVVIGAVETE